ncbi:hypothetical protein D3C78_1114440 [compost metagenome]
MELPSWFLSAIQERLEHVVARIERHPEMRKLRAEESSAFEAMFSGVDRTKLPGFVDWEDKHHYKRGVENEHLYIKGLRDGVQLAITLLDYPIAVFDNPKTMARSEKRDTESEL